MIVKSHCIKCKIETTASRLEINITDLQTIVKTVCGICGAVRIDELRKEEGLKIQEKIERSWVKRSIF